MGPVSLNVYHWCSFQVGRPKKQKVQQEDESEEVVQDAQQTEGYKSPTKAEKLRELRRQIKLLDQDQEDIARDSDDEPDEKDDGSQSASNSSQLTMDGDQKDYVKPGADNVVIHDSDLGEDEDETGETVDLTKLRMVPQDLEDLNVDGKTPDEFWAEDPTRETTLCTLWADEPSLYNMDHNMYRIPAHKEVIIRKFAYILKVPRKFI